MKVAFLNPPGPGGQAFQKEIHRCGDRVHAGERWPPTGLATLAAVARRAGWDAVIHDGMVTAGDYAALVEASRADLLVVLTSTPTVHSDLAIARDIGSRTRAGVVAIGTHVTARPDEALALGADAVLLGEPDATLEAVLGLGADVTKWAGIEGVFTRDATGRTVDAGERARIDDLDALPLPARDLLDQGAYSMPMSAGRPFATVQVARGCPYKCHFCRTPAFGGPRTRQRSVGHVMRELRELAATGVADVAFLADTFTMDRRWVEALCDELAAWPERPRWYCSTRVDLVDEPLLARMKAAGALAVAFGIESANDATLSRANKGFRGESARTLAHAAVSAARAAGLTTLGYFVLGYPGEAFADLMETAAFARSLPLDHAFFHVATPFPGTALFDECLARGELTTTDWRRYEEASMPVISTPTLQPEQVWAARWLAQASFYARPDVLVREARRVRSLADLAAKARAAASLLVPHR
jgi:radical SAM superfamily enzyme YgiQ (UPF0313 family)